MSEEWTLLKRILISGKTSLLRSIIRFQIRMQDHRHIDALLAETPIVRGSAQYKRLLARQLLLANFVKLFPESINQDTLYAAL